jgi:hypothetical protein
MRAENRYTLFLILLYALARNFTVARTPRQTPPARSFPLFSELTKRFCFYPIPDAKPRRAFAGIAMAIKAKRPLGYQRPFFQS